MNFWKAVGILLTLLSATLVNISYIKQVNLRISAIKEILLMIDYIEISIKYQNDDVYEMFKKIKSNNRFSHLCFIDDINLIDDFSNYNWTSSKLILKFSSYTCDLLKGFFSMLGKSDVEGQILNCKTYKEFFKEDLTQNQNDRDKKIKTFSSMVFGITLLILIIVF